MTDQTRLSNPRRAKVQIKPDDGERAYVISSENENGFSGPILFSSRWKTAETFAMRRIVTIKDHSGIVVGFRPMIQQGRGDNRQTHSEVFRITPLVNESMAMAMAQRWRDGKEAELGIHSGRISTKSASRFVPGISLVVSGSTPCRASWKWTSADHPTITKYISKKLGYASAYFALVKKICETVGCPEPEKLQVPTPNPVQYVRLQSAGITELPDRRLSVRKE